MSGDNDDAKHEAENESSNVPPPWRFLVVLNHVCVVAVIVMLVLDALVCPDNVSAPEEEAVGNQGADLNRCQPCRGRCVWRVLLTAAFAMNMA